MDIQLNLFSFDTAKAKLVEIPLEKLPTDAELISPAPSREFVQDLHDRGQLQPIHLNKVARDTYFVIAGRRRIKAFRILAKMEPEVEHWKTIRALVVDVQDDTAILAASAENNRRSQNVLTDLQALDYLLTKDPHMTIERMAKLSGMSQGTVKSRLKLKKLHPDLLQALIDGKMPTNAAEKAAVLPQDMQGKLLVQLANEHHLTLEDVADAQRQRVQNTVDTQLTIPDLPAPSPANGLNSTMAPWFVAPTSAVVPEDQRGVFLGVAVYSIPDHAVLTPVTDDRKQAQQDLEAYQGQVVDPSTLTLVGLYRI